MASSYLTSLSIDEDELLTSDDEEDSDSDDGDFITVDGSYGRAYKRRLYRGYRAYRTSESEQRK